MRSPRLTVLRATLVALVPLVGCGGDGDRSAASKLDRVYADMVVLAEEMNVPVHLLPKSDLDFLVDFAAAEWDGVLQLRDGLLRLQLDDGSACIQIPTEPTEETAAVPGNC